jgi:antitoxin (DNA-binding transcriptional repressor) of toxin-antitoxin stability system
MSKPRRILPATELRVHLGQALRALEAEDLVIEKGGVPVALLTKYRSEAEAAAPSGAGEYESALSHRTEPAGWERMDAVMGSGWAGIEPEEFAANVYRWRAEGVQPRHLSFDEPGLEDDANERGASGRQRRLHPRRPQGKRVADGDAPGYTP